MKYKTSLSIVLSAVALAAGCGKEEPSSQPPDKARPETSVGDLDKLKADTQQAAEDLKNYTYAQKAQFVETLQARLTALNEDMDRLSARIEGATDEFKAQARPKLQALRDQAAQLKQHLDQVTNATESTWDSVKASAQKAYEGLKDGFGHVRQWVNDKLST